MPLMMPLQQLETLEHAWHICGLHNVILHREALPHQMPRPKSICVDVCKYPSDARQPKADCFCMTCTYVLHLSGSRGKGKFYCNPSTTVPEVSMVQTGSVIPAQLMFMASNFSGHECWGCCMKCLWQLEIFYCTSANEVTFQSFALLVIKMDLCGLLVWRHIC